MGVKNMYCFATYFPIHFLDSAQQYLLVILAKMHGVAVDSYCEQNSHNYRNIIFSHNNRKKTKPYYLFLMMAYT